MGDRDIKFLRIFFLIWQAFGAGADFVMMGGMLAGHDQSGGDVVEKNGRKVKEIEAVCFLLTNQK